MRCLSCMLPIWRGAKRLELEGGGREGGGDMAGYLGGKEDMEESSV